MRRRPTSPLRRFAALFVSVGLVLAIAGVALGASVGAGRKAEAIHRDDRFTLQRTLAGLTKQYLQFALKEAFDYAAAQAWALTPDDPHDRAALESFVASSALLNYGAALVSLDQRPITVVAEPSGVPPAGDPGYEPLVRGLLAQGPGLSSVMVTDGVPVVAFAVPVVRAGLAQAVFVAYFRADKSPLEAYTRRLRYGRSDRGYVIDSTGRSVASSRLASVGRPIPDSPALAAVRAGRKGFVEFHRGGVSMVASYAPIDLGGWSVVTEQRASEFFGPIRRGSERVRYALLALLAVAASALALLNHKRHEAMEAIADQAFRDPLTGLANRALFHSRLQVALARARRHGHDVAVLFLDLDRFKVVNDSMGHEFGDLLLVEVAAKVRACIRDEDTLARMGGDEFTILLEDVADAAAAARVADRIIGELQAPLTVAGQQVFIGASIGIALCDRGEDTADDLLRDADLAMYRAKERGKARYEIYETAMGASARAKLSLEAELRAGLERGELLVHYQPIVALDSGEIVGVEALVRWQHPERGLLLPADFLPVAEETGLITTIGRWMLREAGQQARAWHERYPERPVQLSVNLSAREIQQHRHLVAEVDRALRSTGVDPHHVTIEISETAIMRETDAVMATLHGLCDLGVTLAIDDFGTGYSSINYLKRFPITRLKLDRTFVQGLETDPDDAAIAQSVITLARKLRIAVTAEGVETGAQLLALQSMGCERAQGYLFSPPVEAGALEPLLAAGRTVTR